MTSGSWQRSVASSPKISQMQISPERWGGARTRSSIETRAVEAIVDVERADGGE